MSLTYEQLKNIPQYQIAHKLYYKKYPICVRFTPGPRKYKTPEEWWPIRQRQYDAVRWIKQVSNIECYTRLGSTLSVYLLNLDDLARILDMYQKDIAVVEAPINDNHSDTMCDDVKFIVRNRLYYNKYRYRICSELQRSEMDSWIEFVNVIKDFDSGTFKINEMLANYLYFKSKTIMVPNRSGGPSYTSYSLPYIANGIVYLTNYDDVCTLHLMYKSIITDTKKVILEHELE